MPKRVRPINKMQPMLFVELDVAVRQKSREDGGMVVLASENELQPGVLELLTHYVRSGWTLVGLANVPECSLEGKRGDEVGREFAELNAATDGAFDSIVFCPHSPDAKNPEDQNCMCRLPKYGMLVTAKLTCETNDRVSYPSHMMLVVGGILAEQAAFGAQLKYKEASDWRAESLALRALPNVRNVQ
jgi:histidinol phosphatase-like enzyme